MKLGLINSAWVQSGRGTAYGIEMTKKIGFDTRVAGNSARITRTLTSSGGMIDRNLFGTGMSSLLGAECREDRPWKSLKRRSKSIQDDSEGCMERHKLPSKPGTMKVPAAIIQNWRRKRQKPLVRETN